MSTFVSKLLISPNELSPFCCKPLAKAGPICEYLCNFVFSNFSFPALAKSIQTDILL